MKARLLPIYFVIFFGFAGYSLAITIFTPMLLHAHASAFLPASTPLPIRTIWLGFLLALYPLGQFLGSPVIGAISDQIGRRRVLLCSLLATTFFYVFITLALFWQCLWLLLMSSFLAGLCEANIVVAQSTIADVVSEQDRNRFFGYIYLSASAAYIVAPLIGGKLADPHLVSWFSNAIPFAFVTILLFLLFFWILLTFRETRTPSSHGKIPLFSAITSLSQLFTLKYIRRLFFINFLLYFAIFGFFRVYPMYLVDEFHFNVNRVSEYIAYVAVPIVIANAWLTGFLSKRFQARTLTVISAIFTGIMMMIIVIPTWQPSLWITLFFTALFLAICLPSCASMLSLSVSSEQQGTIMGNNQSLQVLAESLSGLGGGLIAAILIPLPLIVMGAIAVFAGVLLLFITRSNLK